MAELATAFAVAPVGARVSGRTAVAALSPTWAPRQGGLAAVQPARQGRSEGFPLVAGGALAALAAAAASQKPARRRGQRGRATALAAGDAAAAGSVGVVLLAGGVGKRMGAKIPKQYLKLLGLEIALHSLNVFLECDDIAEIVVVCGEEYQSVFADHVAKRGGSPPLKFASGGAERQNSVQNGLAEITSDYVAVHDSARPLVTPEEVAKVVADAKKCGAALLAVQTKATIKEAKAGGDEVLVNSTPNRSLLWEAHTPQVIRTSLLRDGFKLVDEKDLEVTDDVSIVEAMGEPVKLTQGEYTNIKVTTPEDIAVAETILRERGFKL